MPRTQFPALFNLSSLNGFNGFKIDGEVEGSSSNAQYWVSSGGDINGDSYADVLIGAARYNNFMGRSYIVFGGPLVGNNELLSLRSLNGTNGFKINGENVGDASGFSVSAIGDINGDSKSDFLIGAHHVNSYTGRGYVVFGGVGVGNSGLLNLSGLNGINGFKLNGETVGDQNGFSLNGLGDINGDGRPDLVIGAPSHSSTASSSGRSYIVFGSPVIVSGGMLSLSSLNGINGFKLDGEAVADVSGESVAGVGDVNGDKYADLLIGAYGHNNGGTGVAQNGVGRSYLLLGGPGIGSSGTLLLSNLNGVNGFKFDGEVAKDLSGLTVSKVGDMNGDTYPDFCIAAPFHSGAYPGGYGRSYVVFGGPKLGNGLLSLANLNGTNGFKLDGEVNIDTSGFSVNTAGDINGDNFADLLIGAPGHIAGRSYVVFGGSKVGMNGTISLSSLNGITGFMLDGEVVGDASGAAVNTAGDINGDSLADFLIGSPYNKNSTGRVYVIYGDISPTITVNQLMINQGQTLLFTVEYLNATDNSPVIFNITDVQHGHFELIDAPGQAIMLFSQSVLLAEQVQFVHDSSPFAPSYLVQVPNTGIALTPPPQAANITFFPFEILNNMITINQGQTISLTTDNLYATSDMDANLQFTITNIQHGKFELSTISNQAVLSFNQQNIVDNQVSFTHDNSLMAPAYTVIATNGQLIAPPSNATIYFDTLPVIVNNQLFLSKGQNLLLNSDNLLAVHDSEQDPNLQFILTNVQHGHFERITKTGTAITIFLQQEIVDEQIVFIPDGSSLAPDYQLQATDGIANSEISLGTTLLVTQNYLPVNQGEILLLKASYLNINSNHLSAGQIDWKVSVVDNGRFALKNHSSYTLTSFTQQQVNALEIVFVPDNSTDAPSCTLVVTDNQNQFYGAIVTNISYDTPPWLVNNRLATYPGLVQFINSALLFAKDNETSSDNLLFLVRNSVNGHFSYFDNQDQTINQFLQKEISNNQIVFVTDDTGFAPAYQISVSDGRMNCRGCPQAAKITFDPVGPHNSDRISWPPIATAAVVIGGIGFLLTVLRWYIKYKLVPSYFEKIQTQGTAVERIERQQMILPIAKYIYDRVKFSSILGYTSETSVTDYVDAVSELVRQLKAVNVDFQDMHLSAQSRLLEVIGIQTQKELVGKRSGCSLKNMKSIVTADTTPALLRASAATIARAVRDDQHSLEIHEEGQDEKAGGKTHFSNFLSSLWKSASQTPQPSTPLLHSQLNSSNYSTN